MKKTVVFDIETHSADLMYTMWPEEFVRLIGYKFWNEDEVFLTTDLEEIRDVLREARGVVGHNIWSFDLPAIFGIDSDEPLEMAMEQKVFDTWTHAVLVHPAPYIYTNRFGKQAKADGPEQMRSWFSLDEQAFQLGVPGKTNDIRELAFVWGDPDLPRAERIRDGFGKIPTDDPDFQDYLRGDLFASEHVARALLAKGPLDAYALREQEIECRKAIISCNGFRVDTPAAQARVEELAERREVIMQDLVKNYGLPSKGKAPWGTDEGKLAILNALADHGITPKTVDWPKTPLFAKKKEKLQEAKQKWHDTLAEIDEWTAEIENGELPPRSVAARERWIEKANLQLDKLESDPLGPTFGLSFGGDELKSITVGTPAEELGQALAELKGQRSLAQLAIDCTHSDGMVHPQITMLQRSGRWSTTDPGLTIWTARGPGAKEKEYYIPDNETHCLMAFDFSNADARAVAAMSGDALFAERFEPGADGHKINALIAWGEEKYDSNPQYYRNLAKPGGHGWGYRIGGAKLAKTWGLPLEEAKSFLTMMNKTFHGVVRWQDECVKFAIKYGYVLNDWGRKMWVEAGREFTQAPALKGQSTTRELMCDALLAMPVWMLRRVKAQIHDELIFSFPRDKAEQWRAAITDVMTPKNGFKPRNGGQRIDFPVTSGPEGDNWFAATH